MRTRNSLFALFLAGSICLFASDHEDRAKVSTLHIEVTAKRFAFDPPSITLKKGQPVELVLESLDVAHGLRFREPNVEIKVGKGGKSEVTFTPTATGTYVGHCSVFCGMGHGTMTFTIRVVD